jgi:hypothetical protein
MFSALIKKTLNLGRVAKEERGSDVRTARSVVDDKKTGMDEEKIKIEEETVEIVQEVVPKSGLTGQEMLARLDEMSMMLRFMAADEKLHTEKVEVVEVAVEEEVSEAPVVAKAAIRPGNSDKTRRRHRKDTTYFQAAADAPEVPVVPEKFKGMTTYFKVDANAPPVPAIPAKYLKKSVPVSTSRTDIAFPSIKTEFTAALTPVKKSAPVLTFSLFALTEDEEEEEDSEELVEEEETVTIKYKEVVRHSPVQTLIRGWEAQEGEAKARRMASGVWWK